MKIKRVCFAVIASVALATTTFIHAGSDKSAEKAKSMETRKHHVMEQLNLSEEQKTSIQAIKDRYQPQFEELHNSKMSLKEQYHALDKSSPDYDGQAQNLKSQIMQVKEEKKALKMLKQEEVLRVLTPEQAATYKEMKEKKEKKYKKRKKEKTQTEKSE